ncbi:MAG: peptidoglycan DD-metalloendopeptidase family protein [Gammaproteobacteria bacterium]|nr:peptidoglycan DD-metalloendopeptidase family protein [Gammaproteobacteria bacterium]
MIRPPVATRFFVFAAILAGLFTGLAPAILLAAPSDDLAKLQQQIQAIQKNLLHQSELKTQNEKLLLESEQKIAESARQLSGLQADMRRTQRQMLQLRSQRNDIISRSSSHREALKTQVLTHYMMGRNHHLKLLLNSEDPALVGRNLAYYHYFNQQRVEILASLDEELARLKTLELELDAGQQQLLQQQSAAQEQHQTLRAQRIYRKEVLAQINQEVRKDNSRLNRLRADEQRLSKLAREIYQSVTRDTPNIDPQKPFAKLKGSLPWPVKGRIENHYGSQRGNGGLRWNGISIRADEGTPVRAVARGRVVFANWLGGYGFLLIIDHGNGYMSLYGHNQQLYKNVGDKISLGETIAQVGSSGGRDEPGLYFEIRRDGRTLDPGQWIARR